MIYTEILKVYLIKKNELNDHIIYIYIIEYI